METYAKLSVMMKLVVDGREEKRGLLPAKKMIFPFYINV